MSFISWLRNRTSSRAPRSRTPHPPATGRFRPRLEALEDRWLPAQTGLTVTSLADSGLGTLRAAIQAADAGSHSDKFTIGFSVTGTINLQSPLPDLNNTIAIQGPGATSLTVERAAGASFASAIITVDLGQTASLSRLTVANGNAGGIANNGTLTVANSWVLNNVAGAGGGIVNFGILTVSGSTVCGNAATFAGGGMFNNGGATVAGCLFSGNSAGLNGGGIDNFQEGVLTVRDSIFSGNSSTVGGGIANGGALTVGGGAFTCNSATGSTNAGFFLPGEGGAICNFPFATQDVRSSTFSGNSASDSGGGLYNLGTATLQECSLSKNIAGSAGGGIFNGASGTLAVKDSTVLNNVAPLGADLYNLGALTLDDSTVGEIGPNPPPSLRSGPFGCSRPSAFPSATGVAEAPPG
jgi:hypothetical protein